jgi:hypothetical protein
VTLGSELREAWEGLGGALITRGGSKLEDVMESERGGDDDDLGDGDPERLKPSLARSLECRLVGGFTNFEKKPGAICRSQQQGVSRSFIQTRHSRPTHSVTGDVDIVHGVCRSGRVVGKWDVRLVKLNGPRLLFCRVARFRIRVTRISGRLHVV